MPPVVTQDPAAAELIQAYADAWADIERRQRELIDNPLAATKRARLREMQDEVARQMAELNLETDDYVARVFPEQYAAAHAAGYQAAQEAGQEAVQYAFRQADRQAAEIVARGLQRDLIAANLRVVESTRGLVRKVGTDATLRSLLQGDTAKQASREMRRILANDGVHAVTYANGRRVGLKGYAEMVVRSQTAIAYNSAAVNGAETAGVEVFEVFDGPSCGWEYHDSPEIANGRVIMASDAAQYPISHPNCRRAFGPRPDLSVLDAVKTDEQGLRGRGKASTTEGQLEAQLAQDDARQMPTRRELAQRRAEAAAGLKGSYRFHPKVDPQRVQEAIRRPDRVLERTSAAEARLAKAAKKAGKPAPAKAASPATITAPVAARPHPTVLHALHEQVPALKKTPEHSLAYLSPQRKAAIARSWSESGLDGLTSPEHSILDWLVRESADRGLKGDLRPLIPTVGGIQAETRLVKYLYAGGKMPTPPKVTATKIPTVYPKYRETRFREVDGVEMDRLWDEAGLTDVTPEGGRAILAYTAKADGAMNGRLREGKGDNPLIKALRSGMGPVPESIRVFRGVNADAFGIRGKEIPGFGFHRATPEELRAGLTALKGSMFDERGFLSTTVNTRANSTEKLFDDHEVYMKIDVPEGTRAAWTRELSTVKEENELILDRGTRLEIYDVEISKTGKKPYATLRARVVAQEDALDADSAPVDKRK